MAALRFLSFILFITLLTGCDYKMRGFMRDVIGKDQQCASPGTPWHVECHYLLTVANVTGNKATGYLPDDAIEPNQIGCERLKKDRDHDPGYVCPNPQDHPKHVYEFEVDPSTPVQAGQKYHFVNKIRSKELTVFKD